MNVSKDQAFSTEKLIESMPFDEEINAKLLHGAALEWLNLEKGSFE